jgi:putative ABC transport system permease protein
MTPWTLVTCGLRHHWRGHLAVTIGVAIAGAVLVGSLLIGDSVRASLEALVSERLGAVEHVVIAPGAGVRAALADELQASLGGGAIVAPVLKVSAVVADPSGTSRVVGVQLLGVTSAYWSALGATPPSAALEGLRPNQRLSDALGLRPGAELIVRIDGGGSTPLDAPMAVVPSSVRAGVRVMGEPTAGLPGRFTLDVHGPATMTALVPLQWLSRLVSEAEDADSGARANTLLVRGAAVEALEEALGQRWQLQDMGLTLSTRGEVVSLRSERIVLPEVLVDAARGAASGEVLTWFANTLRSGDREVPYSFVSAVKSTASWELRDDEVVINTWLADQLDAAPGDTLEIVYPTFGARRTRGEARASFRVTEVVAIEGLAADPSLSIAFPGFAGARSCREWEPGVAIDLERIRPVDEAYWTAHQGTPKAFISPSAAATLWRNPYGSLTSLQASKATADVWRTSLPHAVSPRDLGVHVQPIASAAMKAARPTTDFGGLFMGLGSLLMCAAVILVVLLLRLGIVQRRGEAETLRALGLRGGQIRALRLKEGALTVGIGSAIGLGLGVLVARGALAALSDVWGGAIGGLTLVFAATTPSMCIGLLSTLLVGFGALVFAGREAKAGPHPGPSRGAAMLCAACVLGAIGLLVTLSAAQPAAAYFGAGGMLLVAGLAGVRAALSTAQAPQSVTLLKLAWFNLARRPRASVAITAVLAAGTFVVVGVGVSRHDAARMTSRASGTGGFALVGESTLPVSHALDTREGLASYGLSRGDLAGASVVPLRVRSGDDASCLNLAQAPRPALYGVRPQALAERQAFGADIWGRLSPTPDHPEVVPAIGDAATLTWRLKLGLGDVLDDIDERGRPYKLKVVGVLPTSILQGGLLVDGKTLAERFPTSSSDRLFLIDAPAEHVAAVDSVLSDALGDAGFRTTPAVEVLGRYLKVENTYLAIFLALGGFGLLLGAPGVGVLLFRQVLARRRELAMLQAIGWRRSTIRRLVAYEHGAIVALGVAIGGGAASLAVIPALGSSVSRDPAQAALMLVGGVAAFGFIGVAVATRIALRGRLSEALSEET